jgi:hypothetical protein
MREKGRGVAETIGAAAMVAAIAVGVIVAGLATALVGREWGAVAGGIFLLLGALPLAFVTITGLWAATGLVAVVLGKRPRESVAQGTDLSDDERDLLLAALFNDRTARAEGEAKGAKIETLVVKLGGDPDTPMFGARPDCRATDEPVVVDPADEVNED